MRFTRWLSLLLFTAAALFLIDALAHAQQPQPPDFSVRNLTFALANPPQPVPSCSVQSLNGSGRQQYFYWVVAKFTIGNAAVFGPCAGPTQNFNNPGGTNFAQISWNLPTGAASADVLRTTTSAPPTGSCGCAVTTSNSNGTVADSIADGSLGGYSVNTIDPNTQIYKLNFLSTASGVALNGIIGNGTVSTFSFNGTIAALNGQLNGNSLTLNGTAPPVSTSGGSVNYDTGVSMLTVGNGGTDVMRVPRSSRLFSDYTNSTTSMSNVGTLLYSINANEAYFIDCTLYYQGAATAGLQVQFTGPAAATNVIIGTVIQTNTTNAQTTGVVGGFSTPVPATPVAVGTAATQFVAYVSATIENGVNAGTVRLQAASAAAATLTIKRGSVCFLK